MSSDLKSLLVRQIDAQGDGDGVFQTAVDGLYLMRTSAPEDVPTRVIYRPALCIVLQGVKEVVFGDETFEFGEMQALVVSVELPVVGRVVRATKDKPFLAVAVEFDVGLMREVLEKLEKPPTAKTDARLGVFVDEFGGPIADSVLRLMRMLDTPEAIPILHDAVMREICFWLLTGPNGGEVCKLALPNSHTQRVTQAIHVLRQNFNRPMRIEQLAAAAGMSTSSFHQHFKTLTSMTPLQYQKQLRLIEARRLMVSDGVNVAKAAFEVGYESPSQFSREYGRMFGVTPKRDATDSKSTPT